MRIRCFPLMTCLALIWMGASVHAQEKVTITLIVTAPADTDPGAKLYLAGSLPEVGNWKADGVPLNHQDDGTWAVKLALPKGTTLEYKINGGNWETVEKDDRGEEIENRKLLADADRAEKITVAKWAKAPGTVIEAQLRTSTATGDIRRHGVTSAVYANQREVLVWCPPGYEATTDRYPVLYMHDGQNVFDAATSFAGEWRADEIAAELIAASRIRPILIVAIPNAGAARINEYTPSRDAAREAGGDAGKYARFLVEELKPFIDSTYRTLSDRENTGVCGSSLGGLVSLYICQKHSDIFGICGAVSPSLWWDHQKLMMEIIGDPAPLLKCRLWIDMGTAEGKGEEASTNIGQMRELVSALERAGMKRGESLECHIAQDAAHNEAAWAARFDRILLFLFPR